MANARQSTSSPNTTVRLPPPIALTPLRTPSSSSVVTNINLQSTNVSTSSTPSSSQPLLHSLQNTSTTSSDTTSIASSSSASTQTQAAGASTSNPPSQGVVPVIGSGVLSGNPNPVGAFPASAQTGSRKLTVCQTLLRRCRRRRAGDTTPQEWFSIWLNPLVLLGLFIITLILTGIIIWLTIWSDKSKGFVTIRNVSAGRLIAGIRVGPGLLWTFIPVLISQLYGLWLGTTVGAFSDRQPYVELRAAHRSAPAEQSILLDYRTTNAFFNVPRAFKMRHHLLGLCFTLNVLVTLGVTPFAAHLLWVDDTVLFPQSLQFQRITYFDPWSVDSKTDLIPIVNFVSGIKLYNASYPAWTDEKHSYAQLQEPIGVDLSASTNVSSIINATSLDLNCRALDNGREWLLEVDEQNRLFINGTDRGCSFNNYFSGSGLFEYYMQTFARQDCDQASGDGRVLLFAAYAAGGNLRPDSQYYLISCITTYYDAVGTLNMTFVDGRLANIPIIRNYTISTQTPMDPRPQFWRYFEKSITSATNFDSTATYSTTILGRTILLLLSPGTNGIPQLSADKLTSLMQSTISSIYAVTAATFLNRPVPHAEKELIAASTITYRSRLRASTPIAWTFVGVFVVIAISIVLILIHTLRHRSIQYDESVGILGAAVIAARSKDIADTAEGLRDNVPDGRWSTAYEKNPLVTTTSYTTTRWTVKHVESPKDMVIVKA